VTVAALALIFTTPPALAAQRPPLGERLGVPPTASAAPQTIQPLGNLRAQARTQGVARLILGVRAGFAP
jgi:hypothetical protein